MRRPRPRGFVLVLAVALGLVLLGIGFAMSQNARVELQNAQARIRAEKAMAAADAGLTVGLTQLAASPTYTGTGSPVALEGGPENYTVTVLTSTTPDGQAIPSGCVYLVSTGTVNGAGTQTSCAMVKLGTSGGSAFKGLWGVLANSLQLSNGASIDSYDASSGSVKYGSAGSVATNSKAAGSIKILGGASIRGAISLGPGSLTEPATLPYTVGTLYTMWHDWGTTYGTTTVAKSAINAPSVSFPGKVGTTDLSLNSQSKGMDPGNYRSVQISNGANLKLSAGTYTFQSLSLQGGAQISLAGNGPVLIYVSKSFQISNGARLSEPSAGSRNLQIYMSDDSSYDQQGGSTVTGVVYGPGASVNLSNSGTVYGAVVADSVTMAGSGSIHYDQSLSSFSVSGSGSDSGSATSTILFRQRG